MENRKKGLAILEGYGQIFEYVILDGSKPKNPQALFDALKKIHRNPEATKVTALN